MTSAVPRTTRHRVIFVGDPAQAPAPSVDDLAVTTKPDVYHALGELAGGPAREPVVGVLIDIEHLTLAYPKVVDAFEQLDPTVRLIAVTSVDRATQAEEAMRAGFDRRLVTPIDPADLRSAVLNGAATTEHRASQYEQPRAESPPKHTPCNEGSAEPSQPASAAPCDPPPDRPLPRDPGSAAMDESPSSPSRPHASRPPVDHPEHAQTAPTSDAALGDVDLVRAIMDDPATVHELAVRLIRNHSGRSDITFRSATDEARRGSAATAPSGTTGAVEAPVTGPNGDDHFGWLCVPGASGNEVSAWVEWLGTWLAMDRKMRRLRKWAYQDELTGAWNRRFYLSFVEHAIRGAREARRSVTVMLFDLDDFKIYNDRYGHEAGDEILCETVKLLNSVIRTGDRVCRIGGDEFVVVFADPAGPREAGSTHPDSAEQIARRFQEQVCRMRFPKLGPDAPATLSISAGLATFPWDGQSAESMLRVADERALASKRRGKNAITFGPGSRRTCDRSIE